MFTAAKLLFSGALQGLLRALSAVADWLFDDWRNGPLAIFALAFVVHVFIEKPRLRSDIADMTEQRDAALDEREATLDAFEQTVANTLAAAAAAKAEAEANLARVQAEQAQITQETIDVYQSRLDAARARADRLRRKVIRAAASDPGGAGSADLPGPGNAAGAIDEAPDDSRLPDAADEPKCPPGRVCLTVEEALIATEQAIQLDALIDWTLRQSTVSFAPEAKDDE